MNSHAICTHDKIIAAEWSHTLSLSPLRMVLLLLQCSYETVVVVAVRTPMRLFALTLRAAAPALRFKSPYLVRYSHSLCKETQQSQQVEVV